ncbi:hypothetical protein [Roseiconus lacunae]|uniref:hypothetical protein n=1 Tax=Roseiconus lacunae TaxID=2605694 RepID=UPI0011F141C9
MTIFIFEEKLMNRSYLNAAMLLLMMAVGYESVSAAEPLTTDESPSMNESAARRLKYMQESGQSYRVSDADGKPIRFVSSPALRWTNPVSGVNDGGLFFWEDANGRPVAAAQIFLIPKTERKWLHEFQSLADQPMTFKHQGRIVWSPKQAGVEFKSVDGIDAPRSSPGARLIQMRRITQRFTVDDDFEGETENRLRLMSTPLARYSSPGVIDGALFVYSHGTDPELFVMIEARKQTSGEAAWFVALAPMTAYALKVQMDDQPYWEAIWRRPPHAKSATFTNFVYPPQ